MRFRFASIKAWLRNPRARHLLAAFGLAIGLALAAATAVLVLTARKTAIAHAERELKNTAYVLAEETDRRFQAADTVELGLIDALRTQGVDDATALAQVMASPAADRELQHRIAGISGVGFLMVADGTGRLLATSLVAQAPQIDLTSRDYIHALLANPHHGWFVSAPLQTQLAGALVVVLARVFTARDGQPIGIVGVGLLLRSFEDFFAGIEMRPQSSVALFRSDGILLSRYPRIDAEIGRSFDAPDAYREALAAPGNAAIRRRSVLDGVERLIAPHAVPRYGLIVTATDTMNAALSEWHPMARWMIGGTALTELVLAAIVMLTVRRLRDQEQLSAAYTAQIEAEAGRALAEAELDHARERDERARQARLEAQRLNTALGNMQQGLLMFDAERRLVVVNARFSALCGLPPDLLRPGMAYGEFAAVLASHGNIPRHDLAEIMSRRAQMIDEQQRASFIWETSDGRAFAITHEPMEEGWVATYEDISERRRMDERMTYLAQHDPLTDLPNRVLFRERLELALTFARRGQMVTLLCIDLDAFKAVNDTLGHPVGDGLLQAVAQRLRHHVGDDDNIARLGSDEFAVIQTDMDKAADVVAFAAELIAVLKQQYVINGHRIIISSSIGIAFAPQDGTDADVLLRNADLALHRAKRDGRGCYRLFSAEMDAELQARRELETELRIALEAGQFEVFYQPVVDAIAGTISGFEALLRWRHPVKGLVSPAAFIPLAEEIDLIVPIGAWVLREACARAATWPEGMLVAVNLSAAQFRNSDIVAVAGAALRASGLPAERLELEITESIMLEDTDATLATLQELHVLGVHIAMDDFGTGYSSLSYLRRFPFDRIKIDQSFVREIDSQHDCGPIVRAVLGLSHELGIATTAEGIETREQLCVLSRAGCSAMQGYLFSRPVPGAEIPALLSRVPAWQALLSESSAACADGGGAAGAARWALGFDMAE
ncbi:MAG TPA: EAL domain-containing protein [Acetobacteraceae bacterium]|nr:EAL domain-containing protein [Acetobacteraceae bacterium]